MNIITIVEVLFFFAVVSFFVKKLMVEYENDVKVQKQSKKAVIKLVDKKETDVITKIKEIDASFTEQLFITGAKKAFEIIVGAFNNMKIDEIKNYISKDIYNNFDEVISKRKAEGISSFFELVRFVSTNVKDIKLTGTIASVTVEFTTEQANYLKDKDGNIIEGRENYVVTYTDIWTFTRNLKSKDPNWTLIATQNI